MRDTTTSAYLFRLAQKRGALIERAAWIPRSAAFERRILARMIRENRAQTRRFLDALNF